MRIDIEVHALFRCLERGARFGLDYYEAKRRAFQAVENGNEAKRRHLSGKHKTYYAYFNDNLSFYVVCRVQENRCLIMTVIIEQGRE